LAVNMLGRLLTAHVAPAPVDDRTQVGQVAQVLQAGTGESVDLACVGQG
jgi:hypothetical protein